MISLLTHGLHDMDALDISEYSYEDEMITVVKSTNGEQDFNYLTTIGYMLQRIIGRTHADPTDVMAGLIKNGYYSLIDDSSGTGDINECHITLFGGTIDVPDFCVDRDPMLSIRR